MRECGIWQAICNMNALSMKTSLPHKKNEILSVVFWNREIYLHSVQRMSWWHWVKMKERQEEPRSSVCNGCARANLCALPCLPLRCGVQGRSVLEMPPTPPPTPGCLSVWEQFLKDMVHRREVAEPRAAISSSMITLSVWEHRESQTCRWSWEKWIDGGADSSLFFQLSAHCLPFYH